MKIIHSVIDPNADVDPKYRSTMIATADGTIASGLLVSENDQEVQIFDGKAIRKILVKDIEERALQTQSSMPEGTAATLAPSEFIDLIEYLSAQNQEVKTNKN